MIIYTYVSIYNKDSIFFIDKLDFSLFYVMIALLFFGIEHIDKHKIFLFIHDLI